MWRFVQGAVETDADMGDVDGDFRLILHHSDVVGGPEIISMEDHPEVGNLGVRRHVLRLVQGEVVADEDVFDLGGDIILLLHHSDRAGHRPADLHSIELPAVQNHGGPHRKADGRRGKGGLRRV